MTNTNTFENWFFTKHNNTWHIGTQYNHNVKVGDVVKVTKKNGTCELHKIGSQVAQRGKTRIFTRLQKMEQNPSTAELYPGITA